MICPRDVDAQTLTDMILLLLLVAFLALNAVAMWFGADSRDGRDWTWVSESGSVRGTATTSR